MIRRAARDHREFLTHTLSTLAETLNIHAAVVAVKSDERHLQILCALVDGKIQENFQYELTGTPCAIVLGVNEALIIESNAEALYPRDRMLADLGIESHIGAALLDTDDTEIGIVALMGTTPTPRS